MSLIKKSNELIEARYKFDVWEIRFFHTVLSKIHKDDGDFDTYRIYYKDIISAFGLKATSSYELLRNAARSLMNQKVTVDYEDNGHKREKIYHLIRHIDLLKEGRVGASASDLEQQEYVDIVIESQMRPLLLDLQKNFTSYDLWNIINLSVYSVRVFELLKQYQSIGHRTLYIDNMKRMFNLTNEYPRFSNFYQKVIEPAVREINKHTELMVMKVDKIKEGKKVVALTFTFKRKTSEEIRLIRKELPKSKQSNLTLFDNNEYDDNYSAETIEKAELGEIIEFTEVVNQSEQDQLFMKFQTVVVADFGVSPTVFMSELLKHDEVEIEQAVRVTQHAIKDGKAKNSAAFFVEALRQGFTNPQETKMQKKVLQTEIEAHNIDTKGKISEIEQIILKAINDKIRDLIAVRPEITLEIIASIKLNNKYEKIIEAKEITLNRPLTTDDFRDDKALRDIWKDEMIKTYWTVEFEGIVSSYKTEIESLRNQLR